MRHSIDASNKILGRLASEVAILLRGKNTSKFDPAGRGGSSSVTVYNTDYVRTTGKKRGQKLYRRHSGYPGGMKEETLEHVMKRDSRVAVRRAVRGMLPKNKLRDRFMRHLILRRGTSVENFHG